MLSRQEEKQILSGIDSIMYNLRHVPVEDVAYFLVKFNPKLADELATSISQQIFEKNEGFKHE
jgi:hypothetical protein